MQFSLLLRHMKIIELIRIRTGSDNQKKISRILQQITAEAALTKPEGTVQLFQDNSVMGDFAYFLCWDAEDIEPEGSPLGLKIKRSVETWGIVDYTVWTLIK